MSEMAKQARAAMQSKAKRLTTADPHQKVDSSTWTPPDALNADIKTGMRPISRRAFKSGGKVQGAAAAANMGKSVRSGNKPMTADSMVNKNMKEANQERAGIKHIGALKSGGRAKKFLGGPMMGGAMMNPMANALSRDGQNGGVPAAPAMVNGPNVSRDAMDFGSGARGSPYKKGGKVAHEDEKADMALIKKMVKPSARTKKEIGGAMSMFSPLAMGLNALRGDDDEKKRGGRAKRKDGGGVFTGPGYPGKVPGVVPGGRDAHARGGKTRGKSNIRINIVAGKPAGMGDMMGSGMGGPTPPPPGMDGSPAGGRPVPVPPAPGGGAPAPAAPMPIPYPVPMGGAGGPPPMARKAGGRTYRSYKDMDAGAGSGVGRLEKTEIAEHKRGERKAGGRTYRSYKDMDAGAGSGLGRLEKTEIQAHKR
jgi:hypothetical protein